MEWKNYIFIAFYYLFLCSLFKKNIVDDAIKS